MRHRASLSVLVAAVAVVAALSACGSGEGIVRGPYRSADSALALAARIAAADQGHASQALCGHARGTGLPTEIVAVTARACLSCRGIGSLIRAASRPAMSARVLVAVPVADSAEVCDFLKHERINNPVIGVSQGVFPGEAVGTVVVVASLDSAGSVRDAVFGKDVVDLLPRIEAWRATQ